MKAEDYWVQREIEKNPQLEGMIRDNVDDRKEMFELMEAYHRSQLQALKEEVRGMKGLHFENIENGLIPKEVILDLITKLQK